MNIVLSCLAGVLVAVPISPAVLLAQNIPQVPAVQISEDTLQGLANSQNDTEVEPHIAVDPNNPSILVAVFQEGRFADGGAVDCGYATSHDGGQTWTKGDLPLLTTAVGGPFDRASDPVVAFGPDGAVYAQTIAFGPGSAVAVQRSDDGGLTFGAPVLPQNDNSPDVFNDKNWMAVDTFPTSPHRGRVYIAWDQNNSLGAPLFLRSSDDRGQTWSGVVVVSAANANTIGAIPLVQPNGDLTIVYEDYTVSAKAVAQTSHDGGMSFGPPVTIADYQAGNPPDMRSGALPAAAVDAAAGYLYAVWQDVRFRTDGLMDIVVSQSSDGGATWSALTRVNPDAPSSLLDHFTPAVAALNGRVHVTYRARSVDGGLSPLIDMRYIVSSDNGATFGGERVLGSPADLQFAAQTTNDRCASPPCYFLGDYMGVAVSTESVYPVWCRSFDETSSSAAQHQTAWSSAINGSCGDGVSQAGEECDGADAAACPGTCQSDCTCPCTNELIDPRASVTVRTRRAAGALSAKLVIPLDAYNDAPISVRLDDADTMPIVKQDVGALPPKGTSGKQWQYKVRTTGLRQVTLKSLSPRRPGDFQIIVKAAKWFTAAAANQSAANTRLTITVGAQCFTHLVTKKID